MAELKASFPQWINSEFRHDENSDKIVVVLSQKKSFAFYKTEFYSSVMHLADQQDAYFTHGAPDTAAAVMEIAAKAGAAKVLFVGCSKGGFGSLLLASLCSAQDPSRQYSSLCFGPQTQIYPENPRVHFPSYKSLLQKALTDKAIADDLARFGDVTHVPSSTRTTIVFGNLNQDDRAEAESVKGEKVSLVRLPLKTHSVVLAFLVDNKDKTAVVEIVESLRRASAKQLDLQAVARETSMVEEILTLPRTKSLPALCRDLLWDPDHFDVYSGQ